MICISSNNDRHPVPKTFTPLHYTSPNYTSLHYTCRHFTTLSFRLTPFKFPTAPFHLTSPPYKDILISIDCPTFIRYHGASNFTSNLVQNGNKLARRQQFLLR